jgi:gliding motility-associated-like protein
MKVFTFRIFCVYLLLVGFSVSAFSLSASFTYTKRSTCVPSVVIFTNTSSTGSNITYTWDFGLGSTASTTDNSTKQQTYTTAGSYVVTLTVSDGSSSVSSSQTVTIANGPTAGFTATPTEGCAPLAVAFTSTSTKGSSDIASTYWDFKTGDNATGTSVNYTYNSAGTYSVALTVTDKNGCSNTLEKSSLITVVSPPSANFTASDSFACDAPLNVTFKNLSSGSTDLTYYWDYGNGKTSTDYSNSTVYSSSGSYSVKLKVTDQYGCKDSLIKKSYINIGSPTGTLNVYDADSALYSKTALCNGYYYFEFSNTSLPYYKWTITDDNATTSISGKYYIKYKVKGSGNLTIKLVYGDESSCIDSVTTTYTKSYVKASFSTDTTVFCSLPVNVDLSNSSTNASSYAWYFSDNLFSTSKDTSYNITSKNVSSLTYEQIYNHSYNSISLEFKLIATNSDGCTDTATQEVVVAKPVARFVTDKTSGCIPLQVNFTDKSNSAFTIDSVYYLIDSQKKYTTKGAEYDYSFSNTGEYLVIEIVKSGGCVDTSESVIISTGKNLNPYFTITPPEVCNGGTIQIKGSSDDNAAVDSWSFDSPGVFSFATKSVPDTSLTVYTDSLGYKDVSLQVDYNGCLSDTTLQDIYKITGLSGNFTKSFSCDSALFYTFRSKVKNATAFTWSVDTASYTGVDSVHYKFPKSGDYTVKLVASDGTSGCSLTRTQTVKVRQIDANFTITDSIYCADDTVYLDATKSKDYINSCYNEGFLWDFGDDSPSRRTYLSTYYHVYNQKGTYKLLLVTKADNGCVDSTYKNVYIKKPTGSFTIDPKKGCIPEADIKFTNTSTDSTIVSWVWSFGDNSVDSTHWNNFTHTYTSSVKKKFNPTLTVYDAYQCESSSFDTVTMVGVNAEFQADDNAICLGESVTFTPIDSTLSSYSWTFGDGVSSTTTNIHTYTSKGLYDVTLIAAKDGCRDTVTKADYVSVEVADASFTMSDSTLFCFPDTVYFIHTNTNGSSAASRIWKFNELVSSLNSDSVSYIYNSSGDYSVTLTVKTTNGCKASKTKTLTVEGPSAYYTFTPKKICYNESVKFEIDSMKNLTDWQWQFGDGSTSSNDTTVSHKYTSRGTIIPSITLIDGNCSLIKTMDTLEVSQVEANYTSNYENSKICYGNTVDFTNSSTDAEYYEWKVNGTVKTEDENYKNVTLPKTGFNYVTLIVTGTDNCTDTLTKTYTVVANPLFYITGDSVICAGSSSTTLTATDSTGWSIVWSPSSSVNNSTSFVVTASPSSTTTYTVKVTDENGCIASKEKTVYVNQIPNISRIPTGDTTINIGQTIQLIVNADTTGLSYAWSPNYNISCINCNNPYVSPTKTTTYTVEITNSCVDTKEYFVVNVVYDYYLQAPTAFTPNGDSNNDVFKFEQNDIQSIDLKIYNRWGKVVFSTTDVDQGWDGTVNGHVQDMDTYTYYVKVTTIYGYKFEQRGSFLLLK